MNLIKAEEEYFENLNRKTTESMKSLLKPARSRYKYMSAMKENFAWMLILALELSAFLRQHPYIERQESSLTVIFYKILI